MSGHASESNKRQRAMLDVDGDEQGRGRGGPRLDALDETRRERRRTQIRSAQRAYRGREGDAVVSLENKIKELKEAKNTMRKECWDLLNYASDSELLGHEPELVDLLMKLEALVNQSGAKVRKDDGSPSESSSQDSEPQSWLSNMSPADAVVSFQNQELLRNQESLQQSMADDLLHQDSIQGSCPSYSPGAGIIVDHATPHVTLGISVQPTMYCASFAPTPAYNSSRCVSWTATPSPLISPPTCALVKQGIPFGRRLQRFALHHFAELISQETPAPDEMMRVFGFARLFETKEQIKERTLACIDASTYRSAHSRSHSYQNPGGDGGHFPQTRVTTRLRPCSLPTPTPDAYLGLGSPDCRDPDPFSAEPFDLRTDKIRAILLSLGRDISLPWFDGVFWNADDVEFYLSHNGVSISPWADHYHVVELDEGVLGQLRAHPAKTNLHDLASSSRSALFAHHIHDLPLQRQAYAPKKKAWRIDIDKLLKELTSKAICLGRTPVFQPRDINLAFWASVSGPRSP